MERVLQRAARPIRQITPATVFRRNARSASLRRKRVRAMRTVTILPRQKAPIQMMAQAVKQPTAPRVAVDLFRDLQFGDTGPDVTVLQSAVLKTKSTGVFDERTEKEVQSWQEARGLPVTGYFGPMSRQAVADEAAAAVYTALASTTLHPTTSTAGVSLNITTSSAAAPPPAGAPFFHPRADLFALAGVFALAAFAGARAVMHNTMKQQGSAGVQFALQFLAAMASLWQQGADLIMRMFGFAPIQDRNHSTPTLASRGQSRPRAIKSNATNVISRPANHAVEFDGGRVSRTHDVAEVFDERDSVYTGYSSSDAYPEETSFEEKYFEKSLEKSAAAVYPYNRTGRQTLLQEGYRLRHDERDSRAQAASSEDSEVTYGQSRYFGTAADPPAPPRPMQLPTPTFRAANSPTRKTNSPTREMRTPTREMKSSAKETRSPARETNTPKRETNSPTRETRSPTREMNSPLRETNSPTREMNSPLRETNSPTREEVNTTTRVYSFPTRELPPMETGTTPPPMEEKPVPQKEEEALVGRAALQRKMTSAMDKVKLQEDLVGLRKELDQSNNMINKVRKDMATAPTKAGALATGAAAFGGLVAAGGLDTGIDLMGLAVMEPTMQLAGALAVGGFMARNVLFAEDRKRLLSQYKVVREQTGLLPEMEELGNMLSALDKPKVEGLPSKQQASLPSGQTNWDGDINTADVTLSIHYRAKPGQCIRIVGSTQKLGGWDVSGGVQMTWRSGDIWQVCIPLPTEAVYHYKYVLCEGERDGKVDQVMWQEGSNRTLAVGSGGEHTIRDFWGTGVDNSPPC